MTSSPTTIRVVSLLQVKDFVNLQLKGPGLLHPLVAQALSGHGGDSTTENPYLIVDWLRAIAEMMEEELDNDI